MHRWAAAGLAAVAVAGMPIAAPADASVGTECVTWDVEQGWCLVYVDGGSSSSAQPVSATSVGEGTTACTYSGESIPCTTGMGTWWASMSCYVRLANPQAPQENPVWEGRTEGAIYECS